MKYPSVEDITVALRGLGAWIDKLEKFDDETESLLKNAYLRINYFLRQELNLSEQDTLSIRVSLRPLLKDTHMYPVWLHCHNKQSRHLYPQCISPDDECHCAQLRNCVLGEDVSIESPNVELTGSPASGESVLNAGLGG